MAETTRDLYHDGTGGSHDHLPVAKGSRVALSRIYENRHGQLMAVFQVDDQDSPWHDLEVLDAPRSTGIPVPELLDYIHFDSHTEHLVFQQALAAHHLRDIAASLANMEGPRR